MENIAVVFKRADEADNPVTVQPHIHPFEVSRLADTLRVELLQPMYPTFILLFLFVFDLFGSWSIQKCNYCCHALPSVITIIAMFSYWEILLGFDRVPVVVDSFPKVCCFSYLLYLADNANDEKIIIIAGNVYLIGFQNILRPEISKMQTQLRH